MAEIRYFIPIPIFLIILLIVLPGILLSWLYGWLFGKYHVHKYKKAKVQRRKKVEAIIAGKMELKEDEFDNLMTEFLIDCKYDKDSNANEAVLQKNAELIEKLFALLDDAQIKKRAEK
jgi:hypothetical protein